MSGKLIWAICGIISIAIYWPARHARHYDYIEIDEVHSQLQFVQETLPHNTKNCSYESVILRNSDVDFLSVLESKNYLTPEQGTTNIVLQFRV